MTCVHCGEGGLASGQRFCHNCGAAVPAYEVIASSTERLAPNVPATNGVGDGDEGALTGFLRRTAVYAAQTYRGRLTLYAVGAVLAVAAIAAIAAVLVVAAIAAAVLGSGALFLVILYVASTRHYGRVRPRRHDRWMRRYYKHEAKALRKAARRRGHTVWL